MELSTRAYTVLCVHFLKPVHGLFSSTDTPDLPISVGLASKHETYCPQFSLYLHSRPLTLHTTYDLTCVSTCFRPGDTGEQVSRDHTPRVLVRKETQGTRQKDQSPEEGSREMITCMS